MVECNGKEVLDKLRSKYKYDIKEFATLLIYEKTRDPFKVLIATILTQNSTDKAALRAFNKLEEEVGVSIENLSRASEEEIRKAIRIAGLANSKAKGIKELVNVLIRYYGGDFGNILKGELEEVREKLLKLPRVGEKTADVLLTTIFNAKYFAIDTHIKRVSHRIGFKSKNYRELSKQLSEFFDGHIMEAHLMLITHGRRTCKARKPLCQECVINHCCEYYKAKYNSTLPFKESG
jgi:Predicted EndoIII-related endonuclease